MDILLQSSADTFQETTIKVTGSKSESNRLLLLQALYPSITIKNSSNADDTAVMQKALETKENHIDIHHAGTAMRFLTAFFAMQEGREVVLTGSQRTKERPIAILVDALRQLGANITYEEKEGFPPLRIKGQKLQQYKVTLQAHVSSQYISALLLIAPKLPNGLELTLEGKITSIPYIKMTLALLNNIGIKTAFNKNKISVQPKITKLESQTLTVEADWSSASYFYSIVALCKAGTQLTLSSYKQYSLQGDAVLAGIYERFGVSTIYSGDTITLTKHSAIKSNDTVSLNLSDTPDIAQTLTVTCFGLGIGCELSGLHTLKIKETDRLEALKTELSKLGASIKVTSKELLLKPSDIIRKNIAINTYEDHRMAMAFAPLALKVPIRIHNAEVVSKSYPDFWKDLKKLSFDIKEIQR